MPLLRVTRYFSYSDTQVAKLWRSRRAVERVRRLLATDWRRAMEAMYRREVRRLLRKLGEFRRLGPARVEGVVRAGVDSLSTELDREVDLLLTSPPYLQAQEYIRSFRLELHWLGYSEEEVRRLGGLEIPYRDPPRARVESELFEVYRERVAATGRRDLVALYDAYFRSLAALLSRVQGRVRKRIALLVGRTKLRGLRIPIDEILREHLEALGWRHEVTLVDRIAVRRLFETEVNPATGLPDERTPTEHLLVMSRR